jgi:histidinol-phosphate aminotransferase
VCSSDLGIVDVINRIRGPFNTSIPAQMAGVAAMADEAWVEKARAHNDSELPRVAEALKKLGLSVPPSVGNFILIRFPGGAAEAVKADEALRHKGLILRAMAGYGLPDSLRLTIGTVEENDRLIAALTEFVKRKS